MQQRSAVAVLALRLGRNLIAGARLILFLPVRALDFRIGQADLAVLFGFNLIVLVAGAIARIGFPGQLDASGLPMVLVQVPLLLLAALVIAGIYGRDELTLTLATMWIAGDWVFEIAYTAMYALFVGESSIAPRRYAPWVGYLYLMWALAALARAVSIAAGRARPQFILAGGVIAALFLVFYLFVPRTELWTAVEEAPAEPIAEAPSAASEEIFHLQPTVLAEALSTVQPERAGVTDLYFIGVAAYASQDVFLREITAVERILGERFDTRGRSVTLVNNAQTLRDTPIATATNLRATLDHVAGVMNVDEDVLLLFITTHGERNHELAFELPPLRLQQLTPPALARMLNASGIKWKILVISACYAGGFLEPLRDANTMIVTAAQADKTSFGCAHGRDWTYFGEAFFRDALGASHSFVDAFEAAKDGVAARERREGLTPSQPQLYVGSAIRAKLAELEARLRTPGAGR